MTSTLPLKSIYEPAWRVEVLSVEVQPMYIIQEERIWDDDYPGDPPCTLKVGYTPTGDYIGDEEKTRYLCDELQILPVLMPGETVCSIGFRALDEQWFALIGRGGTVGFGVGSECRKGYSHYHAPDKESFIQQMVDFWASEDHTNCAGIEAEYKGMLGVQITWQYPPVRTWANPEVLPGSFSGSFQPYPKKWGRGEWTAQTLEDAKQMALDWVEGCS